MKTARFILKIIGASLALAASVCLVIAFWDRLTSLLHNLLRPESDDYDDDLLYEAE